MDNPVESDYPLSDYPLSGALLTLKYQIVNQTGLIPVSSFTDFDYHIRHINPAIIAIGKTDLFQMIFKFSLTLENELTCFTIEFLHFSVVFLNSKVFDLFCTVQLRNLHEYNFATEFRTDFFQIIQSWDCGIISSSNKSWLDSIAEIAAEFSIEQLESLRRYLIRVGTLFGTRPASPNLNDAFFQS